MRKAAQPWALLAPRTATRCLVSIGTALALVPMGTTAAAGDSATVGERFFAMFEERAAEAGYDLAEVFETPLTLTVYGEDSIQTVVRPFGEVVQALAPEIPSDIVEREGPFGTPEYVAGNLTHLFATFWAGPDADADANCQNVEVTPSAVVPNTYTVASQAASAAGIPLINPVPVTLAPLFLTPVPDALSPIIPASSYVLPAYIWLGPTMHVKASYTMGLHEVGTLIGSNASTATGAPDPYPIWAPMTTLGFVEDVSVDFLGQGLFMHGELRESFLGYTMCGGVGAMVLSNGAAIFDNHPVLGLPVEFPDLP